MGIFSDLIENIEEQLATQKLLLDYAEKKNELLVDGKIQELEELLKQEEKIVFKSGKLEQHREEIQKELREKVDITADDPSREDPTLPDYIDASEGEEKDKLQELYEELTVVLAQLKELNEQNNQLIQQSLDYVNHALDLFTSAGKDPGTYSKGAKENKGNDDNQRRRNILDKRI